MSIRLYADVWDTFRGNADEKLSALAIADWADDDGRALVTAIELAGKIRVTQPEAVKVISRLVKRGFMEQITPHWFQIDLTRLGGNP
jgi:predicted transcriptional regulator of viral defense system